MELLLNACFVILCAILCRKGGDGSGKLWRRVGLPLAITVYGLLKHKWLAILSLPFGFGVFCLPITLVGDDITKYWYNWVWVFVLGCLIGLIPIYSGLLAIGYGFIFFLLVLLSNLKKTAEFFKWQYLELFFGALIGLLTTVTV